MIGAEYAEKLVYYEVTPTHYRIKSQHLWESHNGIVQDSKGRSTLMEQAGVRKENLTSHTYEGTYEGMSHTNELKKI